MTIRTKLGQIFCVPFLLSLAFMFCFAESTSGQVTFGPPQPYAVGVYPESISIGNFNPGGKLDIAVASHNQDRVDILMGKGDGTFSPSTSVNTAPRPHFVLAAKLAKHRGDDLVVLCEYDPNVYVILGNDDGTFRAPAAYRLPDEHPNQAIVADINHDGIPDLLIVSGLSFDYKVPGNLTVFLGAGDGSLRNPLVMSIETNPYSFAIGDFDGDGNPDLAITTLQNAHPNRVNIFHGNGDGTFKQLAPVDTVEAPMHIAAARMSSNTKFDLVVSGNKTQVLVGKGDGTFTPGFVLDSKGHVDNIEIADFDRDGKLDILVGTNYGAELFVGLGGGSFKPSTTAFANDLILVFTNFVAVGDFQGDKKPDFAVISPSGVISNPGKLSIVLNTTK